MTQEELEKKVADQTAEELDTFVSGYTNEQGTGLIDQLDKGMTDINTQLEQGQKVMQQANDLQTQYTIDEIERQKAETQKGYEKEQKAAYVDYQKQINPYGATAESMAAAGLDNSGYAESSKVAMYNQYQNRVGVAREALTTAIAEYNSSIAAAKVQNSVAMAQLAYDTLLKKMEYTTSHLLKRTELLNQLVEGKTSIVQRGNDRWLDVLDEIESAGWFSGEDAKPQLEEVGNWLQNAAGWVGDTVTNLFGGTTYDEAYEYLKKNGVPDGVLARLMTKQEWRNNKSKSGFDTYQAYIKDQISRYVG